MKNTKKLTISDAIQMLLNWNFGSQPSSVQYITTPELTPEGYEKFGTVTKIANVGVMLGYCYENSVNNAQEKLGLERDFVSQALWNGAGKRINAVMSEYVGLPMKVKYATKNGQKTDVVIPPTEKEIAEYKRKQAKVGTKHLSYKYQQTFRSFYLDGNMNLISYKELLPYFPARKDTPLVEHREIELKNVKKIKFRKTTYELV